jgi:hypothetical protein
MKAFVLLASLLLLATAPCVVGQTRSASDFLAAYREAAQAKSVEQLDALAYRNGMTESDKQQEDASLQKQFDSNKLDLEDVSFAPLPVDYSTVHIAFGKKWESTCPASGMVRAFYRGPHGTSTISRPYAIVDGAYYLTGVHCEDLGWTGPRDRMFVIESIPPSAPVQIAVKWNASGVEQERTFDRAAVPIIAQYIEKVVATESGAATTTTLVVREGSQEIFRSQPLQGPGVLSYTKN